MQNKKKSSEEISWFVPLLLFLILCILTAGIHILKEFKKEPVIPPVVPPIEIPMMEISVSIIIDDMGWNRKIIKEIEGIQEPLTLSFLPFAPYSKEILENLKNKHFEFLLHLPLEPFPPAQCLDKGLIRMDMDNDEIIEQFNQNMENFYPYIKGINNHMGSLFTSKEEKMEVLLKEIQEKNLFFVDSMTSRKSCGYRIARQIGLKTAKRDIFLDNNSDPYYIKTQLYKLVETAKKEGKAIGIGHARPNTIKILKEELPNLKKEGIKIVPVSQLLE